MFEKMRNWVRFHPLESTTIYIVMFIAALAVMLTLKLKSDSRHHTTQKRIVEEQVESEKVDTIASLKKSALAWMVANRIEQIDPSCVTLKNGDNSCEFSEARGGGKRVHYCLLCNFDGCVMQSMKEH